MKKIPPKPKHTGGAPAPLRSTVDHVLALIAKHGTPQAAIDAMRAAGQKPPALRTVYRWVEARQKDPTWGAPDPVEAKPTRTDEPPPTDADRKVDTLVARSRTWRRVQETLAEALAPYPEAARAAAAALRKLEL